MNIQSTLRKHSPWSGTLSDTLFTVFPPFHRHFHLKFEWTAVRSCRGGAATFNTEYTFSLFRFMHEVLLRVEHQGWPRVFSDVYLHLQIDYGLALLAHDLQKYQLPAVHLKNLLSSEFRVIMPTEFIYWSILFLFSQSDSNWRCSYDCLLPSSI